jgi:hypothetical protein
MKVDVMLVANGGDGSTSVSTTIDLDVTDADWRTKLVDAVTIQAHEGAQCLRDQLGHTSAPAPARARPGFTPLAQVLPMAIARR